MRGHDGAFFREGIAHRGRGVDRARTCFIFLKEHPGDRSTTQGPVISFGVTFMEEPKHERKAPRGIRRAVPYERRRKQSGNRGGAKER